MNETRKAEAEAVVDAVQKHMEPRVVKLDDGHGPREVLLAPQPMVLYDAKKLLAHYRDAPERRMGRAELTDLASFIAHVNRNKDEDSAIFADVVSEEPSLLAVYDYHRQGPTGAPRFGAHRAIYEFPIADEWTTWTGKSGQLMPQDAFCAFIEDHLVDVAAPADAGEGAKAFAALFGCAFASASRLLELSRGLSLHINSRVQNKTNLASGEVQFVFTSEHNDQSGKPINLPGAFLLALPIFRGGVRYQIAARLRYRHSGSTISWAFELHRAQAAIDHALSEAANEAREKTGLPLFMGGPEGANP